MAGLKLLACDVISKQKHLTLGFQLCLAQKCNYGDGFFQWHSFIFVHMLFIYWNLSGVFSLIALYSFLCRYFIASVLKPLNLVQTLRPKAVDFWKVKINHLLQSSLNWCICLQTCSSKKVAQETCSFLLCVLALCCMPVLLSPFNFFFNNRKSLFLLFYLLEHFPSAFHLCLGLIYHLKAFFPKTPSIPKTVFFQITSSRFLYAM